jgi:DNA polymerase III alpha subunit
MIQLRIRTEYHFGQTFAKVDDVIKRLKEIGCTAAAIVDKSTWGHTIWHKACKAVGIKPLLGVEIAVTDDVNPTKMWFIAKNQEGLKEIYNFNSLSYEQPIKDQKFGNVNRLYTSDVVKISKTNNVHIFAGDVLDGEFLAEVNAIIDLNPSSQVLNKKKKQIAEQYNLRLVSTSDNAYCSEDDIEAFQIISKSGKKMTPQHILDKLDNQVQAAMIADQCELFEFRKAPTIREEGDLEALCRKGIVQRGMDKNWSEQYEERLKYELELIKSKDFDAYFIIVSEMVRYAKQHMLVGPSRGSSAGSLVCYLSGITEIDPIPPGLYFERFIDVSRSDLPDIDLDFPDKKRHIIFEYI